MQLSLTHLLLALLALATSAQADCCYDKYGLDTVRYAKCLKAVKALPDTCYAKYKLDTVKYAQCLKSCPSV
ncbi:hypothetical protein HDV00_010147 [Rhizophlyctis rosea]|nr:hypothetical protein HDV00_010147 [Rhizophlyctis rosea]